MLLGDLGESRAARSRGTRSTKRRCSLFRPIKCMLASPEPTAEAIWARLAERGRDMPPGSRTSSTASARNSTSPRARGNLHARSAPRHRTVRRSRARRARNLPARGHPRWRDPRATTRAASSRSSTCKNGSAEKPRTIFFSARATCRSSSKPSTCSGSTANPCSSAARRTPRVARTLALARRDSRSLPIHPSRLRRRDRGRLPAARGAATKA